MGHPAAFVLNDTTSATNGLSHPGSGTFFSGGGTAVQGSQVCQVIRLAVSAELLSLQYDKPAECVRFHADDAEAGLEIDDNHGSVVAARS